MSPGLSQIRFSVAHPNNSYLKKKKKVSSPASQLNVSIEKLLESHTHSHR